MSQFNIEQIFLTMYVNDKIADVKVTYQRERNLGVGMEKREHCLKKNVWRENNDDELIRTRFRIA